MRKHLIIVVIAKAVPEPFCDRLKLQGWVNWKSKTNWKGSKPFFFACYIINIGRNKNRAKTVGIFIALLSTALLNRISGTWST